VVDEGSGNYNLQAADYSNPGNSFSTTQAWAAGCADESAEWIAEDPVDFGGLLQLADYGSWFVRCHRDLRLPGRYVLLPRRLDLYVQQRHRGCLVLCERCRAATSSPTG
jgi:hypothetical protein